MFGGVEMSAKRLGRRAIGALALVAIPLAVGAQEGPADERIGDQPTYEIEGTTVISAAKLPVPLDKMGAAVSVLDRDDLRYTPSQSLPDILSSGAGLHTYDFAGNGMTSSVESRGFAAQRETSHLQFLLDGLPFMDFADDNALWNLFDLDQLDRIEILRSASSAMHGNTAFTGVVNVVPVIPRDRWSVNARVGGGSHGRFDLTQSAGWRADGWSGTVSGRWRQIDGWRDHSKWSGGSGYGSARIPLGAEGGSPEARVALLYGTSDAELPGPLPKPLLDADPTVAATPFDRDEMSRIHAVAAMSSPARARNPYRLSIQVSHEDRSLIETILDTQEECRTPARRGGVAGQDGLRFSRGGWRGSGGRETRRRRGGPHGSFGIHPPGGRPLRILDTRRGRSSR
jgi:outer membrane receptor protein involved in Fe transport